MHQQDFDFFAQRALEEQAAADRAQHSEARRAHQRLADQYQALANIRAARTTSQP